MMWGPVGRHGVCASPATAQAMNTSLRAVNRSPRHTTLPRKAKRLARDARIVFEVTLVIDKEALNDHCAENHRGATCRRSRQKSAAYHNEHMKA